MQSVHQEVLAPIQEEIWYGQQIVYPALASHTTEGLTSMTCTAQVFSGYFNAQAQHPFQLPDHSLAFTLFS